MSNNPFVTSDPSRSQEIEKSDLLDSDYKSGSFVVGESSLSQSDDVSVSNESEKDVVVDDEVSKGKKKSKYGRSFFILIVIAAEFVIIIVIVIVIFVKVIRNRETLFSDFESNDL